jgi:hypothetical protein
MKEEDNAWERLGTLGEGTLGNAWERLARERLATLGNAWVGAKFRGSCP